MVMKLYRNKFIAGCLSLLMMFPPYSLSFYRVFASEDFQIDSKEAEEPLTSQENSRRLENDFANVGITEDGLYFPLSPTILVAMNIAVPDGHGGSRDDSGYDGLEYFRLLTEERKRFNKMIRKAVFQMGGVLTYKTNFIIPFVNVIYYTETNLSVISQNKRYGLLIEFLEPTHQSYMDDECWIIYLD